MDLLERSLPTPIVVPPSGMGSGLVDRWKFRTYFRQPLDFRFCSPYAQGVVMRFAIVLAISFGVFSQQATASEDPTKHACSVLPRAEVRKHVPWPDQMEQIFPQEQEDQFANGSGCEYPSVRVQVMSTTPEQWRRWIETSKNPTVERVAGVGDEAYIRDNKGRFAEFYAKSGAHLVSLQKNLNPGETTQATKPQLVALAKALVEKLR